MAIDRADWHWDSAEKIYREKHKATSELTEEQEYEIWLLAGNHIGLFLRWIIDNNLEGEEADEADCGKVRAGQMSGAEYLLMNCDGKLWDEDIKESSLPFVEEYYNGNQYFDDYCQCCIPDGKLLYEVISDENDYQLLRPRIDEAYQNFLSKKQ